jgi:disulfide bond formation protein DsbB
MFNTIAAIGTIALQLGIVALIIGWIAKVPFVATIAKHAGIILAVIFSAATLMSFIYQYGFGYEPCLLCWYQRILIIPIAILAWTADLKTNKLFQNQLLTLSIIGFAIALFHVYIDVFPTGLDVCGATGVSCLVRYVYEFGYITIPVMSATVLGAGIVLILLAKRYPHNTIGGSIQ